MYSLYVSAFALAFALNLVWENAHMHLYKNFNGDSSPLSRFLRSLYDSFMDAVLILSLFLVPAMLLHLPKEWPFAAGLEEHVLLAALGGVVATIVEWRALRTGRWQYTEKMPLVPILKVGLSPLVQLMVLPSAIASLTRLLV